MNLQNLSNKDLYALCRQYGKNVRKWSREFGFLLPEVARRGMYRKYHCTSIYEFAAKLAGMSHDITSRILNLSEKLKDKPLIWDEFQKYGWTKLLVIAGTVTVDTQEFWLDKLRKLPRPALQEYLKTWKENNVKANNLFDLVAQKNCRMGKHGSHQPETERAPDLCYKNQPIDLQNFEPEDLQVGKELKRLKFKVDSETEFEFRKFKQAMEKEKKETLTMGETLKFLLKKVKELENKNITILQTKNARQGGMVSGACHDKPSINPTKPVTRKVSQKRQNLIITFYNGKCAFPECNQPYSELHHPDRFSLKKSHQKIYPLCKTHHQAAHSGLIKNEDQTIEKWEFNLSSGQQPTNQQKKSLKVALPAIPLVTPELSASRLENIFDLYQASQKDYVDSRVRNHWIT